MKVVTKSDFFVIHVQNDARKLPSHAGADPASKFRGGISVIFGSQVS